ncbi:MAG: UbiA family prenyltransferase [Saprospirales bacterium]|nr:UbiA family prenyltransferase [Saprospirales bacterium]
MSRPNSDKWLAALLLLRPVNLLFIALTQYLLLFQFLFPALSAAGAPIVLEGWRALLFLFTTTLLTGAGYAMNDLYDVETDRINKPGKWLIGNRISRSAAMNLTGILLCAGALASAFLAFEIGKPALWFIYPGAVLALLIYSRNLKGIPLAGNIFVAFLCSMVAGILWYAEREGISMLREESPADAAQLVRGLLVYLSFAFLATFFRELVKDCEDLEGDAAAALKTLPAKIGLRRSAFGALVLGVLLGLGLLGLSVYFLLRENWAGMAYTLLLLTAPLAYGLWLLTKAGEPGQFRAVSRIAKWVIFAGVFLILFL